MTLIESPKHLAEAKLSNFDTTQHVKRPPKNQKLHKSQVDPVKKLIQNAIERRKEELPVQLQKKRGKTQEGPRKNVRR